MQHETIEVFGSFIHIIGTEHTSMNQGTSKKELKQKLSQIKPDIVCIEFPKNHPKMELKDIKSQDVNGAVEFAKENNISYEPIDKYFDGMFDVLDEELSDREKYEIAEMETGKEVRKKVFNDTDLFKNMTHNREQTMVENILNLCKDNNTICFVVGSSHVIGIKNGLSFLSSI